MCMHPQTYMLKEGLQRLRADLAPMCARSSCWRHAGGNSPWHVHRRAATAAGEVVLQYGRGRARGCQRGDRRGEAWSNRVGDRLDRSG